MINVKLKNNKIYTDDKLADILAKDAQVAGAYWRFLESLKEYDAQKIEITFKCKVPKQVEQKKFDSRQHPMDGHKNNWRKGSRGPKPDMSETEHMKIEKEELNT